MHKSSTFIAVISIEIVSLFIMEMLNAYLRDLLLLHDCVIIPGFGGFVGNYESAKKTNQDYFTPPRKAIAFNPQLKHNDGLLANTIVAIEKVEYNEAIKHIEAFAKNITKELKAKGSYTIPSVGKFENGAQERILFTPDSTTNFLLSPVGMGTFHITPYRKPLAEQEESRKGRIVAMPLLRKVLVAGVSGFALISLLLNPGEFKNLTLSSIAPTSLQEQVITESKPLSKPETLTETNKNNSGEFATTAPVKVLNYHVIVGCFSIKENAETQKAELASRNIDSEVFSYSGSLTAVSAGSFETFEEAKTIMEDLRNSGKAPSAWVLKRKLH